MDSNLKPLPKLKFQNGTSVGPGSLFKKNQAALNNSFKSQNNLLKAPILKDEPKYASAGASVKRILNILSKVIKNKYALGGAAAGLGVGLTTEALLDDGHDKSDHGRKKTASINLTPLQKKKLIWTLAVLPAAGYGTTKLIESGSLGKKLKKDLEDFSAPIRMEKKAAIPMKEVLLGAGIGTAAAGGTILYNNAKKKKERTKLYPEEAKVVTQALKTYKGVDVDHIKNQLKKEPNRYNLNLGIDYINKQLTNN